jgi:hypothetical protein
VFFVKLNRVALRGALPGAARQPLTFLVSPRKVSKRRRPRDAAPAGFPKGRAPKREAKNSPSLRSELRQLRFFIRFAVPLFGSATAEIQKPKAKSHYTEEEPVI